MSRLDAGGDESPNFAALSEAQIRVYADRKATEAAEERRALLRGVADQLGGWSPENAYRCVFADTLYAAGLLDDEQHAKMRVPVPPSRGGLTGTV